MHKELDKWQEKLEVMLLELKQCQESYSYTSCNSCDKFFECEIRKRYVVAVYDSMSKGSTGGFEF